jgi:uroporphyrinogen-III synthase
MSAQIVLITRPRAEAETTARLLAAKSWVPFIEPLLEIVPLKTQLPNLSRYHALIFTSAQGVYAFSTVTTRRNFPVYAVGPATAAAAIESGFTEVKAAAGDLKALNDLLTGKKRSENRSLLHIGGVHTAGAVEVPGLQVDRLPLYAAKAAQDLSPACLDGLDRNAFAAALFFSPRTGAIFAGLLKKYGRTNAVSSINALCLSDSVVESLKFLPWRDVQAAPTPGMAGMMALLGQAGPA